MPNVTIQYQDDSSLTVEEIVRQAISNYGDKTVVEITASSQLPHDQIYWAIQQIVTKEQISAMFDRTGSYQVSLHIIKQKALKDIVEILDQDIQDNEAKVEGM